MSGIPTTTTKPTLSTPTATHAQFAFRSPTFGDRFDAASSPVTPPKTPPKTATHPLPVDAVDHRRFADHMSCVYNTQSPSGKTILITTTSSRSCSSSPARSSGSSQCASDVIGPSSQQITIFTHHHHHNGPTDSAAAAAAAAASAAMEAAAAAAGGSVSKPSSAAGSVGINILINNHFNEMAPAVAKEPLHIKREQPDGDAKPTVRIKSEPKAHDDSDVSCAVATADRSADATSPKGAAADAALPATVQRHSGAGTTTTTTVTVTSGAAAEPHPKLRIGDEVFVRLTDERFYLGTVTQLAGNRCLVRLPGDQEHWSMVADVQSSRPALAGPKPWTVCIVCKTTGTSRTEKCVQCGRAYHPGCAGADASGVWMCRRGHHNRPVQDGFPYPAECGASRIKHETQPEEFNRAKLLPYVLSELNWDVHHLRNVENVYCYCGGPGDWYREMLQCGGCKQWFHERCVGDALAYPLYCGDRFFVFACRVCNGGKEFVRRQRILFDDIVHLLLFNLHMHNEHRRFFDVSTVIVPYAIDNWHTLQLSAEQRIMSYATIRDSIAKCLSCQPNRFRQRPQLGLSESSGASEYGMCCRTAPPMAPLVDLATMDAQHWPLSDDAMVQLRLRNANNAVQLLDRSKPVADLLRFSSEMRYTMSGRAYMKDKATDAKVSPGKVLAAGSALRLTVDTDPSFTSTNVYDYCSEREDAEASSPIIALRSPKSMGQSVETLTSAATACDVSRPTTSISGNSDETSTVKVPGMVEHTRNKRKRYGLTMPKAVTAAIVNSRTDSHLNHGALDSIIPPPKDFSGPANPFLSLATSVIVHGVAHTTKGRPRGKGRGSASASSRNSAATAPACSGAAAFGGSSSQASGQLRLVRTVKRRLSAKDLVYGPNMEVKRRKLLRPNAANVVGLISTTAISYRSKVNVLHPEKRDNAAVSRMPPPPPPAGKPQIPDDDANAYGGRQLRKRISTNYAETNRRSSINGNSATMPAELPASACSELRGPAYDVHATESSLPSFVLGSMMRTKNGQQFTIYGKRRGRDGLVQYLINWDVDLTSPAPEQHETAIL